jgi:fructosamine-3-kinase
MPWQEIARAIAEATGQPFQPVPPAGIGGGCINQAYRLSDGRSAWFVKTNRAAALAMFEAEAAGLRALSCAGLRTPRSLCTGTAGQQSFIVLEYLELGRPRAGSWRQAGEHLAALHGHGADAFGWEQDNTIGATPQQNTWESDWVRFWRERRLGFQLAEARRNGHRGRVIELGERLLEAFPALLVQQPRPSLLHGDLWSGNLAFDARGEPVVYDPACYFGDADADLAMTELFGGFDQAFYEAYRGCRPASPGYPVRRDLYNLYHVLNHLNLFGGGYLQQSIRLLERLLAEC